MSCYMKGYRQSKASTDDVENNNNGEPTIKKVKLNYKRYPFEKKRCIICKKDSSLKTISHSAIMEFFMKKNIVIFHPSTCCPNHLTEKGYLKDDLPEPKLDVYMSGDEVTHFIDMLQKEMKKKLDENKGLNFEDEECLSSEDYERLTGITKSNFHTLVSVCEIAVEGRHSSLRTCIGILLMKLRTGNSSRVLATLFKKSKSAINRAITKARKILIKYFVPLHLGSTHLSREELIRNHTRRFAEKLLETDNELILIADGTYIYLQKSSNYKLQRMTFSMHKHRPLMKPMIVITTTGYIIDAFGPYFGDGNNNDANILKNLLIKKASDSLGKLLQPGDYLIVDRGFRDALDFVHSLLIETKMPHFLPKNQNQHTTQEANESRFVTSLRWVVEATNSLIKKWKALDQVFPNQQIPHIEDYVRIVCAICNAFRPPRVFDQADDVSKAESMKSCLSKLNHLQQFVEDNKLTSRSVCWESLSEDSVPDFPRLSINQLKHLTFGVYQIKQAISYTEEHLDDDGTYELQIFKFDNSILQVKLQSRHVASKVHKLWIEFNKEDNTITGWYCKCKAGARTVGCCAHIAAALWFLAFYRHQEKKISRPSRTYGEAILNAVDEESDVESEDSSDWDDIDECDNDSE